MLCDECGRRQAVIHMVSVGSKGRIEKHLCRKCAMKYEYNQIEDAEPEGLLSMDDFLKGVFNNAMAERAKKQNKDVLPSEMVCPHCGMSYQDFQQTSRVGCAQCYQVFKPQLMPILRRLHGASVHRGKVPQRSGGTLKLKAAINKLRANLQECVASEDYEKAAEYRDEIRSLEQKLAAGKGGQADDQN